MDNIHEVLEAFISGAGVVACYLLKTRRVRKSIELFKEFLILFNKAVGNETELYRLTYITIWSAIFEGFYLISDFTSMIECGGKLCALLHASGDPKREAALLGNLGYAHRSLSEYGKAEEYHKKALVISKEIGDRRGEAVCYGNLGNVYRSLGEYGKAEEYQKKALVIIKESDDREGEAACYRNLGTMYEALGEYGKAEECQKKALVIIKDTDDRESEALCYINLGNVYQSLSEYGKAEECQKKALTIMKEIDNRGGKAACYVNLGTVCESLGEYGKAEEYQKKALVISEEIGDRKKKAVCYGNLGTVYRALGEYGKAEEHQKKALVIRQGIGDKEGEAACYGNLGTVYQYLCEYGKAEEYEKKALVIRQEIGDRKGEAVSYGNLGTVYQYLGEYGKAEEYQRKALAITQEIGDRKGEALCLGNLGVLYQAVGEYSKAEQHQKKALGIRQEIGDRFGKATCYGNLGAVYGTLGEYDKAEEYEKKALEISQEIGNRQGEATSYGNLGTVYQGLGEYSKVEEYHEKQLVISKEIGDRRGEALCYKNLGTLFRLLGAHAEAKDYHEKALEMSRKNGDIEEKKELHLQLAYDVLSGGHVGSLPEAFLNLFASMLTCEQIRSLLRDNEQFKISLLDQHIKSYHLLSGMLCCTGEPNGALYVVELGRARALADLMSARYSVKQQIRTSVNQDISQESDDFERIMKKEIKCNCLYISYFAHGLFLWVLKENKPILFRTTDVNEGFLNKGSKRNVDEIFGEESALTRFHVLNQGDCEDRSLFPSDASHSTGQSSLQVNMAAVRLVEQESEKDQQPVPTLAECYNMIIAPVADLLDEPELLIAPDCSLYKVPFAALKDENGKYLSDTFRIRIVPSLNTLKLIQDSPRDYHSQIGALIVGEPDVSEVLYKGRIEKLCPLPCARKEAEMIGRLLGAQPLLGNQATKGAVLQSIHSVSLIHFAAHGNAERGEIALAPHHSINGIPREEDYLLTMADISQVQLRAKLVVLSCCHSASGRVRAEGVIGIARAFLGSGARSVLVALWALGDSATEQLMGRFYEHLACGESASESLHQAMKWMRSNGYPDVRDWAPFMLIGDNVTFDFRK